MKKTMDELNIESREIQAKLSKYSCKPVPFEDRADYNKLRKRLMEVIDESITLRHEECEAKRQAFADRSDIKEIRDLLKAAILRKDLPVYYEREEADSYFGLQVISADEVHCGGYAEDEFGENTVLDKISMMDLAGILEYGEETEPQETGVI